MNFLDIVGRLRPNHFYKRSYAIDGEDVLLDSLYESNSTYKGFYIDIGANHPLRYSNTQLFYEKGWRGINIDATPGSMVLFNKLRPEDKNIEIGVGSERAKLKFFSFYESALNSFDEKLSNDYMKSGFKLKEKIDVSVETINAILDKNLPKGQKIDLLNIDVEGFDLNILGSLNWNEYKPDYIIVEELELINKDLSEIQNSEMYKLLKTKSYQALLKTKRGVIYGRYKNG